MEDIVKFKKNGREGRGGLFNKKKKKKKKNGQGLSEGAGLNQELKILFNSKQTTKRA